MSNIERRAGLTQSETFPLHATKRELTPYENFIGNSFLDIFETSIETVVNDGAVNNACPRVCSVNILLYINTECDAYRVFQCI